MTTKDRRQDVRQVVNIPVDITIKGRVYHGLVENMSEGGVFVEIKGPFAIGQDVAFYFFGEMKFAIVVWVKSHGIGLKFGHWDKDGQ